MASDPMPGETPMTYDTIRIRIRKTAQGQWPDHWPEWHIHVSTDDHKTVFFATRPQAVKKFVRSLLQHAAQK